MTQTDLKNKRIGILGIGIEGMASLKFLLDHGARVTMLDQKEEKTLPREFVSIIKSLNVPMILGGNYLDDLKQFDIAVRSPGIPRLQEKLLKAQESGVQITSHTQLFFDLCPCPIIGVTGTKGKGTTSTLIYEMLKKQGFSAYLGGNIGLPPLTFLDKLDAHSKVVLELSSFQLQDLTKSPHIAVMLMIAPEHMDYHGDMAEYVDAKRNILRFQTRDDFAILNRDYIPTLESDIFTDGHVYFISRERPADQGCYIKDDAVWVRENGVEKKITATNQVQLPGKHNLENVCAAVMAAILAGVEREAIVSVLKSFTGLEHRLELVREVKGVKYYDDSFSTTPETAIAAVESFTQPEILVLGGSSKNSDFTQLGLVIRESKNIKAIIGIGEEWERIKGEIGKGKSEMVLIEGAKDMPTVVQAAAKIATNGDVILLSPACASFGMFKNYKDRGEQFKQAVMKLES